MNRLARFILFLLMGYGSLSMVQADVPETITYQGSLKQSGTPVNGTQNLEIRLTNSDGTQVYWTSGSQQVELKEGNYKLDLSPTGMDWETMDPYIEVKIDGNLLLPREKITSTPFALMSKQLMKGATAQGDFHIMGVLTSEENLHAKKDLSLDGKLGIGATTDESSIMVENFEHGLDEVHTFFGAGYASQEVHGFRQMLVQQIPHWNWSELYIVGNGEILSGQRGVPADGPNVEFQAIEFNDFYFGLITKHPSNGDISPSVVVTPSNGYVGMYTDTPTERLEVNGNIKTHGGVLNWEGRPAFLVNVESAEPSCGMDTISYSGCPNGYVSAGYWFVGNGVCDGSASGVGYDNGMIDSGWMQLCTSTW